MQAVAAHIDELARRRIGLRIPAGGDCFIARPGQRQASDQGEYHSQTKGDAAH
jgi:hypothetical protein